MGFPRTRLAAENLEYGMDDASGRNAVAYDPTRCAYSVSSPHWYDNHQCSRKPGHGPDELFCKQHAKKVNDILAFWDELAAARVGARGDTQP